MIFPSSYVWFVNDENYSSEFRLVENGLWRRKTFFFPSGMECHIFWLVLHLVFTFNFLLLIHPLTFILRFFQAFLTRNKQRKLSLQLCLLLFFSQKIITVAKVYCPIILPVFLFSVLTSHYSLHIMGNESEKGDQGENLKSKDESDSIVRANKKFKRKITN